MPRLLSFSLAVTAALLTSGAMAAPANSVNQTPPCVAARKAAQEMMPGQFNAALEEATAAHKELIELPRNVVAMDILKANYQTQLKKYHAALAQVRRWYALQERVVTVCVPVPPSSNVKR